jgi:hypothetical protein
MSDDVMLEAGWPAHYATYTGRTYEAICADMRPIEERLLQDEPTGDDVARYAVLCDEWRAHPITMDEAQAAAAWLTRLLEEAR